MLRPRSTTGKYFTAFPASVGPSGFLSDCQSKRAKTGVLDRLRFDRVLSIEDITNTAAELPAHFKQLLNGPAARKSAREKARREIAEARKQDEKTVRQVRTCLNALVARVVTLAAREKRQERAAEKAARLQAQKAARQRKTSRANQHLPAKQVIKATRKQSHFPSGYSLDCPRCGRIIQVPTQARGTRCPECKRVIMAAVHFVAGKKKRPRASATASSRKKCRCGSAGCWC